MVIATWVKSFLIVAWSILRRDASPKVVFYHDIGKKYTPMGTEEKIFMKHMKILGSRRSRDEISDLVCFDDGFHGLYDYREEIRGLGLGDQIPVKVFIAPRLVGQKGYLTWDEIRELQNNYGIDFQCHTWSHQTLSGPMIDESPREERDEEWFNRELITSKDTISKQLGKEVTELCFPVGYFSDDVVKRCRSAGYEKVYASFPSSLSDEYMQGRCIVQSVSPLVFKAILNGGLAVFSAHYFRFHYHESARG